MNQKFGIKRAKSDEEAKENPIMSEKIRQIIISPDIQSERKRLRKSGKVKRSEGNRNSH